MGFQASLVSVPDEALEQKGYGGFGSTGTPIEAPQASEPVGCNIYVDGANIL